MVRLCDGIWTVCAVEMQKDVPHVGVVKTGCQGLCELGPLSAHRALWILQYVHVQDRRLSGDCRKVLYCQGEPVERLFYQPWG